MRQQAPFQRVAVWLQIAAGGVGLPIPPRLQITAAGQQETVANLRRGVKAGNAAGFLHSGAIVPIGSGIAGNTDLERHGTPPFILALPECKALPILCGFRAWVCGGVSRFCLAVPGITVL